MVLHDNTAFIKKGDYDMRQVAVRIRYLARHFSYNSMNKYNVKKKHYLPKKADKRLSAFR